MDMNTIKELTNAIDDMDKEVLRDTLAYLLKVYVIDQAHSYKGAADTPSHKQNTGESTLSFAELIRELKNQYSMEELNLFTIEGGNVFVSIQGNSYQLTRGGNTNTTVNQSVSKKEDTFREKNSNDPGLSPSGRFEKLELD